ncbi:MAG: YmdB family metallophosphoesterase [Phycisphaeraceae bacterium]|nr:YmdB family metallophosphoesterase [Phycisphaeraceae bacterium]
MPEIAVAFLGDVVGVPGRRAVAHAAGVLRERHGVRVVIANGENARHGSGISPDNYRELRRAAGGAVDAVTLGDHCFRERGILPLLAEPGEPISRPANLAAAAPGKRIIRLAPPSSPPLYVLTVLGRLFMTLHPDSPFAAIDRELTLIPEPDAVVIVEVHAEATSEKQAVAWHCLGRWSSPGAARVVAVVGTHTHVQTSDARVLDRRLAAMTDLGMCGPHRSVIGRSVSAVLEAMVNQGPAHLDVASDDVRAQGCVITIDTGDGRATAISAFDIPTPD